MENKTAINNNEATVIFNINGDKLAYKKEGKWTVNDSEGALNELCWLLQNESLRTDSMAEKTQVLSDIIVIKDDTIERLKDELDEKQNECDKIRAELDNIKLNLTASECELAEKEKEIARLDRDSQKRHELIMLKVDAINSLQKEIAELESSLFSSERFRMQDGASHNEDIIIWKSRYDKLQSSLNESKEANGKLVEGIVDKLFSELGAELSRITKQELVDLLSNTKEPSKCTKCGANAYSKGKPFCTDDFCNILHEEPSKDDKEKA